MKPKKFIWIFMCIILTHIQLSAQDKLNIKFGKITPQDFDLSANKFDTGAAAVVIADMGYSSFEGNNKGWFSLVFKHYKRMKVLNKNGFDIGKVVIRLLSTGSNVEKLPILKAVTYNLENGQIVETKLDENSVFTDKLSKNIVTKKFTFPALKEGSIIEFSYTQQSDFLFNLQPWEFQGEYPVLWSEYQVDIPDFFNYVFLGQGYHNYFINTSGNNTDRFTIRSNRGAFNDRVVTFDGKTYTHRWVMKDVAAIKKEAFTTTIENHISKLEFQLSQYEFPNMPVEPIMGTWKTANDRLMKEENFGASITKNNGWLDDDMKSITKGASDKLQKARLIYTFLRDHFTCTERYGIYMSNTLKTVFTNRSGSESEINLLLTAMLNHEQIESDPVILSTRNHGYTSEIYPLMERFNYVICSAKIDNTVYYLDASQPRMGFGNIPYYCYNGHARVINQESSRPVYFYADSLKEQKMTSVNIVNDEKARGMMKGSFQTTPGYGESFDLREKISKKGEQDFFKNLKASYNSEVQISNPGIDSLKLMEYPVSIHYDFTFSHNSADLYYFNPMMSDAYKENPLKAAERKYPVEMPSTSDEIYVFNMEIPTGYIVEEIPKSTRVNFNETEGFFEYLVSKDEDNIQLRSRIKLNKANFTPDDYDQLREFFSFIVKKQSEQIVFKKKK